MLLLHVHAALSVVMLCCVQFLTCLASCISLFCCRVSLPRCRPASGRPRRSQRGWAPGRKRWRRRRQPPCRRPQRQCRRLRGRWPLRAPPPAQRTQDLSPDSLPPRPPTPCWRQRRRRRSSWRCKWATCAARTCRRRLRSSRRCTAPRRPRLPRQLPPRCRPCSCLAACSCTARRRRRRAPPQQRRRRQQLQALLRPLRPPALPSPQSTTRPSWRSTTSRSRPAGG